MSTPNHFFFKHNFSENYLDVPVELVIPFLELVSLFPNSNYSTNASYAPFLYELKQSSCRFCALDLPGVEDIKKRLEGAYKKDADDLALSMRKGAQISIKADESVEAYTARFLKRNNELFLLSQMIGQADEQKFRRNEIAKQEFNSSQTIAAIIKIITTLGKDLSMIMQMTSPGLNYRVENINDSERLFFMDVSDTYTLESRACHERQWAKRSSRDMVTQLVRSQ